jgi:hypothetical protein
MRRVAAYDVAFIRDWEPVLGRVHCVSLEARDRAVRHSVRALVIIMDDGLDNAKALLRHNLLCHFALHSKLCFVKLAVQ